MAVSALAVSLLLFYLLNSSTAIHNYSVTIITSPEQGPFRSGQAVNFYCVVEPEPPDNVTYQWRTMDQVSGGSTYTRQNISYRYSNYFPSNLRFCWYVCEVRLNQTLLGSASRMVEVHGVLYTRESVVRSYSRGGKLQLNVNIATDYYARYISSLAWYHNGTRIVSGNRFNITNRDTVLTVTDMNEFDAGAYEVKINSIDVESGWGFPNNQHCDSTILPLLESLAVHAPVTFTVQENTLPTYALSKLVTTHHICAKKGNKQYIELRNNYTQLNELQPSLNWYRNGSRLADGELYNSTSSVEQHTLQITYINYEDAIGNYVGVLSGDSYRLDNIGDGSQCNGYYYYVNYDIYVDQFPLAISYFQILLPRQPSLNILQSVLTRWESTVVECIAIGGEPRDVCNLTLWRNNKLLDQVIGDHLNFSTGLHPYGAYQCAVDNLHSSSSILYEKVHLQLILEEIEPTHSAELMDQQKDMLKVALNNVLTSLCPTCENVIKSHIENVQLNYTGTGQFVYVTADLVYSDSAGRITASTLLDMFQTWMLSQESPALLVNGTRVFLNKQCLLQLNPVTHEGCINLTVNDGIQVTTDTDILNKDVVNFSNEPVGSNSLIIGGFFGGIIAGMIIMAILTGLIMCIKWLRSKQVEISLPDNNNVVDIPMDSNQAYETVDVRYETAKKGNDQEETIYEIPAELS